jgi:muconolactone delta-isomerase
MNSQVSGIAGLYEIMQEQTAKDKNKAKQIFLSVTNESVTQEELLELVSPEVMMQLIFLCIDLTKSSRAVVNQLKSKEAAKNAKLKAQGILHAWLDMNFHRYKGYLNNCADEAVNDLPRLGKSWSWVRKEITAYAKSKKQVG